MISGMQTMNSVITNVQIKPWRYPTKGIAVRLFLTCWIVFTLHFATNTVREVYLALAIGDHFSFRVDEYAHMHPDIFEKEGYGWHVGNNPGISMLAAIPYALSRPIIDPIVEKINQKRSANNLTEPPLYDSPWPMAREFYRDSWKRGYDIKFGLASFVMQSMCMAPSSALGAVVMFYLMRRLFGSDKTALGLSLLYAFGTPVFFRTGFLNHNLMLGHIAFMGFLALWNPGDGNQISKNKRFFLGGLAGGAALLFDYSGVVLIVGLFIYGLLKRVREATISDAFRCCCWYVGGTLGPVGLLLLYQWQSFGHPLYPGQHWMPPVEWIELGYQGYGWPKLELLTSPIMLLALASPIIDRGKRQILPRFELIFLLVVFFAFLIFFSGSNYVRLQYNTGIRYMSSMFPFLFVPTAIVLMRLPRLFIYFATIISIGESWCLAMHRDVERGLGLLDPILNIFISGFKLPAMTVLSRMGTQYGEYFSGGVSPLPLFAFTAAILYVIWSPNPLKHQDSLY
jgi:hypothetical protein